MPGVGESLWFQSSRTIDERQKKTMGTFVNIQEGTRRDENNMHLEDMSDETMSSIL